MTAIKAMIFYILLGSRYGLGFRVRVFEDPTGLTDAGFQRFKVSARNLKLWGCVVSSRVCLSRSGFEVWEFGVKGYCLRLKDSGKEYTGFRYDRVE